MAATRIVAVSLLFTFVGAAATGCRTKVRRGTSRVIFVLLDTARADRFSANGYPRKTTPEIDRLAERGVVFLRHFSQATTTAPSLPSLLFSRYFAKPLFPLSAKVPLSEPDDLFRCNDPESISLPRALSGLGYSTALISAHLWIKPGTAIASEFDEVHDLNMELKYPEARTLARQVYPPAKAVIDYAIGWMRNRADRNYFLYLHLMDMHFPHTLRAEGRSLMRASGLSEEQIQRFEREGWGHHEVAPREARIYLDGLYDGSLQYADRHLGRLFAELRKQEALEDTLIVITADHGDHLLEAAGRMGHGGRWYDAVAHIPLVLFYPKKLGPARASFLTENVDVLPTVMALLGASLPPGKTADGVDLSEFLTRRRPPREFAVGSNAIRTDRYKAIFGSGTLRGARVSEIVGELYDLASDPLETRTLWSTLPDIAVRLLEAYRSRVGGPYRRYLAARTEEQPDSAFAIASKDFGLIPAMPEELEARRWQKSDDWESFFLSAQPNARSLEVGFAIPNGVYAVTAALAGSAEVTLGEGSPIRLEGTSIRSSDKPPLDQLKVVEVATITVSDRRFAARLLPTGQSPFVIRYFGFSPVGRKPLTEADEEKLRALGYVR